MNKHLIYLTVIFVCISLVYANKAEDSNESSEAPQPQKESQGRKKDVHGRTLNHEQVKKMLAEYKKDDDVIKLRGGQVDTNKLIEEIRKRRKKPLVKPKIVQPVIKLNYTFDNFNWTPSNHSGFRPSPSFQDKLPSTDVNTANGTIIDKSGYSSSRSSSLQELGTDSDDLSSGGHLVIHKNPHSGQTQEPIKVTHLARSSLTSNREQEDLSRSSLKSNREEEAIARSLLTSNREQEDLARSSLKSNREQEDLARSSLKSNREQEDLAHSSLTSNREHEDHNVLKEETMKASLTSDSSFSKPSSGTNSVSYNSDISDSTLNQKLTPMGLEEGSKPLTEKVSGKTEDLNTLSNIDLRSNRFNTNSSKSSSLHTQKSFINDTNRNINSVYQASNRGMLKEAKYASPTSNNMLAGNLDNGESQIYNEANHDGTGKMHTELDQSLLEPATKVMNSSIFTTKPFRNSKKSLVNLEALSSTISANNQNGNSLKTSTKDLRTPVKPVTNDNRGMTFGDSKNGSPLLRLKLHRNSNNQVKALTQNNGENIHSVKSSITAHKHDDAHSGSTSYNGAHTSKYGEPGNSQSSDPLSGNENNIQVSSVQRSLSQNPSKTNSFVDSQYNGIRYDEHSSPRNPNLPLVIQPSNVFKEATSQQLYTSFQGKLYLLEPVPQNKSLTDQQKNSQRFTYEHSHQQQNSGLSMQNAKFTSQTNTNGNKQIGKRLSGTIESNMLDKPVEHAFLSDSSSLQANGLRSSSERNMGLILGNVDAQIRANDNPSIADRQPSVYNRIVQDEGEYYDKSLEKNSQKNQFHTRNALQTNNLFQPQPNRLHSFSNERAFNSQRAAVYPSDSLMQGNFSTNYPVNDFSNRQINIKYDRSLQSSPSGNAQRLSLLSFGKRRQNNMEYTHKELSTNTKSSLLGGNRLLYKNGNYPHGSLKPYDNEFVEQSNNKHPQHLPFHPSKRQTWNQMDSAAISGFKEFPSNNNLILSEEQRHLGLYGNPPNIQPNRYINDDFTDELNHNRRHNPSFGNSIEQKTMNSTYAAKNSDLENLSRQKKYTLTEEGSHLNLYDINPYLSSIGNKNKFFKEYNNYNEPYTPLDYPQQLNKFNSIESAADSDLEQLSINNQYSLQEENMRFHNNYENRYDSLNGPRNNAFVKSIINNKQPNADYDYPYHQQSINNMESTSSSGLEKLAIHENYPLTEENMNYYSNGNNRYDSIYGLSNNDLFAESNNNKRTNTAFHYPYHIQTINNMESAASAGLESLSMNNENTLTEENMRFHLNGNNHHTSLNANSNKDFITESNNKRPYTVLNYPYDQQMINDIEPIEPSGLEQLSINKYPLTEENMNYHSNSNNNDASFNGHNNNNFIEKPNNNDRSNTALDYPYEKQTINNMVSTASSGLKQLSKNKKDTFTEENMHFYRNGNNRYSTLNSYNINGLGTESNNNKRNNEFYYPYHQQNINDMDTSAFSGLEKYEENMPMGKGNNHYASWNGYNNYASWNGNSHNDFNTEYNKYKQPETAYNKYPYDEQTYNNMESGYYLPEENVHFHPSHGYGNSPFIEEYNNKKLPYTSSDFPNQHKTMTNKEFTTASGLENLPINNKYLLPEQNIRFHHNGNNPDVSINGKEALFQESENNNQPNFTDLPYQVKTMNSKESVTGSGLEENFSIKNKFPLQESNVRSHNYGNIPYVPPNGSRNNVLKEETNNSIRPDTSFEYPYQQKTNNSIESSEMLGFDQFGTGNKNSVTEQYVPLDSKGNSPYVSSNGNKKHFIKQSSKNHRPYAYFDYPYPQKTRKDVESETMTGLKQFSADNKNHVHEENAYLNPNNDYPFDSSSVYNNNAVVEESKFQHRPQNSIGYPDHQKTSNNVESTKISGLEHTPNNNRYHVSKENVRQLASSISNQEKGFYAGTNRARPLRWKDQNAIYGAYENNVVPNEPFGRSHKDVNYFPLENHEINQNQKDFYGLPEGTSKVYSYKTPISGSPDTNAQYYLDGERLSKRNYGDGRPDKYPWFSGTPQSELANGPYSEYGTEAMMENGESYPLHLRAIDWTKYKRSDKKPSDIVSPLDRTFSPLYGVEEASSTLNNTRSKSSNGKMTESNDRSAVAEPSASLDSTADFFRTDKTGSESIRTGHKVVTNNALMNRILVKSNTNAVDTSNSNIQYNNNYDSRQQQQQQSRSIFNSNHVNPSLTSEGNSVGAQYDQSIRSPMYSKSMSSRFSRNQNHNNGPLTSSNINLQNHNMQSSSLNFPQSNQQISYNHLTTNKYTPIIRQSMYNNEQPISGNMDVNNFDGLPSAMQFPRDNQRDRWDYSKTNSLHTQNPYYFDNPLIARINGYNNVGYLASSFQSPQPYQQENKEYLFMPNSQFQRQQYNLNQNPMYENGDFNHFYKHTSTQFPQFIQQGGTKYSSMVNANKVGNTGFQESNELNMNYNGIGQSPSNYPNSLLPCNPETCPTESNHHSSNLYSINSGGMNFDGKTGNSGNYVSHSGFNSQIIGNQGRTQIYQGYKGNEFQDSSQSNIQNGYHVNSMNINPLYTQTGSTGSYHGNMNSLGTPNSSPNIGSFRTKMSDFEVSNQNRYLRDQENINTRGYYVDNNLRNTRINGYQQNSNGNVVSEKSPSPQSSPTLTNRFGSIRDRSSNLNSFSRHENNLYGGTSNAFKTTSSNENVNSDPSLNSTFSAVDAALDGSGKGAVNINNDFLDKNSSDDISRVLNKTDDRPDFLNSYYAQLSDIFQKRVARLNKMSEKLSAPIDFNFTGPGLSRIIARNGDLMANKTYGSSESGSGAVEDNIINDNSTSNQTFETNARISAGASTLKQEGCLINGTFMEVGEEWTVNGVCGIYTCTSNQVQSLNSTCPKLQFKEDQDCVEGESDPQLEFPLCCPYLKCTPRKSVMDKNNRR